MSVHAHKWHQHLKKRGKVISEHAHKWHQQHLKKKEEGNSGLGMLIKGTTYLKLKRGVKYAQNMSTIAKKNKKQSNKKQKNFIFN